MSTVKTFLEEIKEMKKILDIKRATHPSYPDLPYYMHKVAPSNGTIPLTGYAGGHRGYIGT